MALTLITRPSLEPVSLIEARLHLKIDADVTEDDTLISNLIKSATEYCQTVTGRQFVTATYEYILDRFPRTILPPLPPLVSVTSLKYIDTAGAEQTLTEGVDFTVDTDSEPGRVCPEYNLSWPSTRGIPNAMTLRYVAGYDSDEGDSVVDTPYSAKQAILLLVAHGYEFREPIIVGGVPQEVQMSVNALLWANRIQVL